MYPVAPLAFAHVTNTGTRSLPGWDQKTKRPVACSHQAIRSLVSLLLIEAPFTSVLPQKINVYPQSYLADWDRKVKGKIGGKGIMDQG